MYVVLQGIGFLPCIRLYIIYVISFGEQQPWMPAVPKLESFNQKKQNDQFLFILNLQNDFFKLTEGYPHNRRRRIMKKLFCDKNQWN